MPEGKDSTPKKVQDVEAIMSEFNGKKELLTRLCEKTKLLVEDLLTEHPLRYQSIQARVKSEKKLKDKFLDPSKNYRNLDDITDQAGLRIVTYYEDEVDLVAELIAHEFNIDAKNSVDRRKRNQQDDKFGYHAVNYVCQHSETRLSQTEYKKFRNVQFEIQITSVLRHAWAEIEHGWYDLNESYPTQIKRRFSRMAALLEIAESEFSSLKKEQDAYQRSIAVQIGADVSGVPINAVSVSSLIEQFAAGERIDLALAGALNSPGVKKPSRKMLDWFSEAALFSGLKTIADLQSAIELHEDNIVRYAGLTKKIYTIPPTPLNRGAFIFRLAFWLAARNGKDNLLSFFKKLKMSQEYSNAEIKALVKIAQSGRGGRVAQV